MNDAQRIALQAFWNTFGKCLFIGVACLVYMGMLWLGSKIANAIGASEGWRLVAFVVVMAIQIGLAVSVAAAWKAYQRARHD